MNEEEIIEWTIVSEEGGAIISPTTLTLHDQMKEALESHIMELKWITLAQYIAKEMVWLSESFDEKISLKALSKIIDATGASNVTPIINLRKNIEDMSDSSSLTNF